MIDNWIVSEYRLRRLTQNPQLIARYAEVERILEPAEVVEGMRDMNADLAFEAVIVPAWAGRQQIVGLPLLLADGTPTGSRITSVNAEGRADLDIPLTESLTGSRVTVYKMNVFGSHVVRLDGREWINHLDSSIPVDAGRMQQLLVEIVASLVVEWLAEVGETRYSAEDVASAAMSMIYRGVNVDALIAQALERVELDRRAGTYVPSIVDGNAP